jgi:PAS domain S-box-containing protein
MPNAIAFVTSALVISWLNGKQKRANADLVQENRNRRKAEEALRASEQRLQDIVDNTTAVIFVKDLELHYLLVNREFERLHQVQRDQIRGKTDFELHPPVVAETVRPNDQRVIEAGEPIQFEEVVPSFEGERVYVSAKFLLRDPTGKPYAVCAIATDNHRVKTCRGIASVHGPREGDLRRNFCTGGFKFKFGSWLPKARRRAGSMRVEWDWLLNFFIPRMISACD